MSWKKYRVVVLLAKRDILEDRKVSLVVIAALSFSFLNLAFFPAFISGFSESFVSNIIETRTGHINIAAEEGRLEGANALVSRIERMEGVESVEKQLRFEATVSSRSGEVSAPVIGVESDNLDIYSSRTDTGEFLGGDSDGEIVIGLFLKQSDTIGDQGIETEVGERLTVRSGGKEQRYDLVGVVGRQGPSGAAPNSYIAYDDAEEFLGVEDEATTIKVLLDSRDGADSFKRKLERRNVRGDIRTWEEVSEVGGAIDATFGIVTAVVSLVGVIVAVAAIGVVIFINVNKRRREIGILRSIGAQSSTVMAVFVLEALIFGLIGVALGNAIMLSVHAYLSANPLETPLGPLATEIEDGLLLTRSLWLLGSALAAGILPSWFASRQQIVEAIENR